MDPAHLLTILSSRTSKISLGLSGLPVSTTPKLKSSAAFGRCAVSPPLMTAACEPQFGWKVSRFSSTWGQFDKSVPPVIYGLDSIGSNLVIFSACKWHYFTEFCLLI
jgi:hypothetical protein